MNLNDTANLIYLDMNLNLNTTSGTLRRALQLHSTRLRARFGGLNNYLNLNDYGHASAGFRTT